MRSHVVSAAAYLLVSLLAADAPLFAQVTRDSIPARVRAAADRGETVRVIVGIRAGFRLEGRLTSSERTVQRAAIRSGIERVVQRAGAALRARPFTTIPFFAAEVDRATLDRLAADPDVKSIEEDVPEPPLLADSVPLVGAPEAWSAGYSGAGWAVAVLDTGVDTTHSFFIGKVVAEACFSNNGAASAARSLCPGGVSSSTAPGSAKNCVGTTGCDHGTHVAGIAAGKGPFSGVAVDSSLIPIQVFTRFPAEECGFGSCLGAWQSDQILALEHVLALSATHKIAAVNMSLGGGLYPDQELCDALNASRKAAIDNLRSAGIATVVASGNSGSSTSMGAPACISSAVSVGSTDKADVVSAFSNGAPYLSLLAPGASIRSSVPGNNFGFNSGTSMASPHVAGAWAILKSRKPDVTVADALQTLRDTGVAVVDPRNGSTVPRIRVDRAVKALSSPRMSLDAPSANATVTLPFVVSGWAIDSGAESGTGVDAIHVYAFPSSGAGGVFLGVASYGTARADVGSVYGSRFLPSGFELAVTSLAPGAYQLVAYAHVTASGAFDISRVASITVEAPATRPRLAIDSPRAEAAVTSPVLVSGWAADLVATTGTGVDAVHVYAYPADDGTPVFLGAAAYGMQRNDTGAAYGLAFTNTGYQLVASLPNGRYTLVVFARSTVTGEYFSNSRAIAIRDRGLPLLSIDTPAGGASDQPLVIAGWAIDLDARSGAGVDAIHVWAFPADQGPGTFLGAAGLGGTRGDVAAIYGSQFDRSGFHLTAPPLAPGDYQIAVYVHSAVTGVFSLSRAVAVTLH